MGISPHPLAVLLLIIIILHARWLRRDITSATELSDFVDRGKTVAMRLRPHLYITHVATTALIMLARCLLAGWCHSYGAVKPTSILTAESSRWSYGMGSGLLLWH